MAFKFNAEVRQAHVVTHGTKVPAHEIWAGIPAKKVIFATLNQADG